MLETLRKAPEGFTGESADVGAWLEWNIAHTEVEKINNHYYLGTRHVHTENTDVGRLRCEKLIGLNDDGDFFLTQAIRRGEYLTDNSYQAIWIGPGYVDRSPSLMNPRTTADEVVAHFVEDAKSGSVTST